MATSKAPKAGGKSQVKVGDMKARKDAKGGKGGKGYKSHGSGGTKGQGLGGGSGKQTN